MSSSKQRCSALFFSVVDSGDGALAMDAAASVASHLGSSGLRVLVAGGESLPWSYPARRLSRVLPHADSLEPDLLRGALTRRGGSSPGFLLCDEPLRPDFIACLERAYSLVVLVSGASLFVPILSVPGLLVADASEEGEIARAGEMVEAMLSSAVAPLPVAFALYGGDGAVGVALSSRWRLPFWGDAKDPERLAEGILNQAATARPNRCSTFEHKISEGCDAARVVAAGGREQDSDFGRVDRLAREVLTALREERQFREMDLAGGGKKALSELKSKVAAAARRIAGSMGPAALAGVDEEALISRVVDDAAGLGPIETMLADPEVTEIMVNGDDEIYLERRGVIEPCSRRFLDRGHLMAVIERMVAGAGRRVDELSPMVDARLPDGSRLNVVIPPLAIDGPAVTIRRFVKRMRGIEDAISSRMITREAADFLSSCVASRVSILVSGGTGAGKTTLLGILAGSIGPRERIITIEDAAELNIGSGHVVRLESRPPGMEGSGAVTIRDLVRNALRMRPDRIIVGEARGPEALDMLQAMNTGHEGSLATIHANSPRDAISRLETMVLMAGAELPLAAVREQIVRAVGLVVQVARLPGGERRVTEIAELSGMEGTTVCVQAIARMSPSHELEFTGIRPGFMDRIGAVGAKWNR